MPAIICQVLHKRDRLTFIWSQGTATFEPYVLQGSHLGELFRLAEQARERFAQLLTAPGDRGAAGFALAQAGHAFYQSLFAADHLVAREVRDWLESQNPQSLADLEVASDAPGHLPWNLLYDQSPNQQAFAENRDAAWQPFWGMRYGLSVGRRTNPLRQAVLPETPTVLLALDPVLRDGLSAEQRNRLTDAGHPAVTSKEQLAASLRAAAPDLLYIFARADPEGVLVGGDLLTPADLQKMLEQAPGSVPSSVVFLNACDNQQTFRSWQLALEQAAHHLPGLVACEHPLPPEFAHSVGLDFIDRFVRASAPVARLLKSVRSSLGGESLAYSNFCPTELRFENNEDPALPSLPPLPLPQTPYRPLAPYEREDRPLFMGRDAQVFQCADMLDRRDTSVVLLHGGLGVGKASFVRAGLLPFLEDDGPGFRALRDRTEEEQPVAENDYPILAIRTSSDLTGQLAQAIAAFADQPYAFATPTGRKVTVDLPGLLTSLVRQASQPEVASAIRPGPAPVGKPGDLVTGISQPGHAPQGLAHAGEQKASPKELYDALQRDADFLGQALATITERLPFELVLLIEQGEELITLASSELAMRRRDQALTMLANVPHHSARCKVLIAMRAEFLGPVLQILPAIGGAQAWAPFFLPPLPENEVLNAMLLPTTTEPAPFSAEAPHAKYGFAFEAGLAPAILDQAQDFIQEQEQSLLPLAQAVCASLWDLARQRNLSVVRAAELKAVGGVRGALARYAENKLKNLPLAQGARKGLRRLVESMQQRQPDGTLTRELLAAPAVRDAWSGPGAVDEAVQAAAADDVRIFEFHQLLVGGQEGLHVSLTQDALAQVGAQWQEADRRKRFGFSRIMDVLWIAIPLMVLLGVVGWVLGRRTATHSGDEMIKGLRDEYQEQVTRILESQYESLRWPMYVAQIAQARQAWEAGNVLRMRQLLLGLQPTPTEGKDNNPSDQRSFEWYYLWRLANGEKHALLGHVGLIQAVAVSPDNLRVATASTDGVIKLWDLATGREQATLSGHKGAVYALAFSGDSKTLASAGEDKDIRLWQLSAVAKGGKQPNAPKQGKSLAGHGDAVTALAFAKDGTLASTSKDKTARLWDVGKEKERLILKDHADAVQSLAFAADGKTLATGSADHLLIVWNAETGKPVHTLKKHQGPIDAVAFAPDGKTLVSAAAEPRLGSQVGAVYFWDPASGKELPQTFRHAQGIFALAYAPDGKTLVSAGKDHLIRLWDTASAEEREPIKGHLAWVRALAFGPDGRALVSGSLDGSARIWPFGSTRPTDVVHAHGEGVLALALSPDDSVLASAGKDGSVKLWDLDSGALLAALPGKRASVTALAFATNESPWQLALGLGGEGEIHLWDIDLKAKDSDKQLKEGLKLTGHKKTVTCLAFHADGKTLASGSADSQIILWNLEKGKAEHTLMGQDKAIRSLAFGLKGQVLASGGDDTILRLWDARSGKKLLELPGHAGAVTGIAWVDRFPVTASADLTLKIWEFIATEGPGVRRTLRGHTQAITSLVADPDARFFLSASWDGSVRLWSPGRGEERFIFTGHTAPVRAVVMAGDLQTLASAGDDGTIRFWRAVPEGSVTEPLPKTRGKED